MSSAIKEKTGLPARRTLFPGLLGRNVEEWFDRPFGDFMRMFRENLLTDLNGGGELELTVEPAVNMHLEGNNLVVEAMVPGIKKEELKIDATPTFLTVTGEAKREKEVKKENVLYKQFSSTRNYKLQLQLPVEVKAEKAEAELKNGILALKLPTVETIESAKVPIAVK